MDFKKWILQLEIGDNYGAPLAVHRPDKRIEDENKRGVGGMPTFDMAPLPGNKKALKKKSKKK